MRRTPFQLLSCDHCGGRYTDVGPRHLCPGWAEQIVAKLGPRTPVPVEPVEAAETQHSAPERKAGEW